MSNTLYSKDINFELKELRELQRLLRVSIIESSIIEYIVEKVPLYTKLTQNIKEFEKLEIPF